MEVWMCVKKLRTKNDKYDGDCLYVLLITFMLYITYFKRLFKAKVITFYDGVENIYRKRGGVKKKKKNIYRRKICNTKSSKGKKRVKGKILF